MKIRLMVIAFAVGVGVHTVRATTIAYTYDTQHRLVTADYSQAQPDTHVTYQYDAANNVNLIVAITDSQWLQSFKLWLSLFLPEWIRTIETEQAYNGRT